MEVSWPPHTDQFWSRPSLLSDWCWGGVFHWE